MSEPKFTPGPWHAMYRLAPSHHDHGFRYIAEMNRRGGKFIYAEAANVLGDVDADSALIAAAPELYAALDEIEAAYMDAVRALNALGEPAPARLGLAAERARAALAKARGESC